MRRSILPLDARRKRSILPLPNESLDQTPTVHLLPAPETWPRHNTSSKRTYGHWRSSVRVSSSVSCVGPVRRMADCVRYLYPGRVGWSPHDSTERRFFRDLVSSCSTSFRNSAEGCPWRQCHLVSWRGPCCADEPCHQGNAQLDPRWRSQERSVAGWHGGVGQCRSDAHWCQGA